MRPIETILLYVVIPAIVLLLLFALTALRPSGGEAGALPRRGRRGTTSRVWWIGNPKGTGLPEPTVDAVGTTATRTARGGARGTW